MNKQSCLYLEVDGRRSKGRKKNKKRSNTRYKIEIFEEDKGEKVHPAQS